MFTKFTNRLLSQPPVCLTPVWLQYSFFILKINTFLPHLLKHLAFRTLELRAIFQVLSFVKVFHHSLFCNTSSSKTLPYVPGCQTFPFATVSSALLTFTSSHRSIQSITTKDSHCSKETDLSPWAPIKIYYFYSPSACCNWSFGSLPGRICCIFISFSLLLKIC